MHNNQHRDTRNPACRKYQHPDFTKPQESKAPEHIGVVVGHIVEFLTSVAKQLPDMELYTNDIDLKVKDGNISVCLTARNKADTSNYEDEEELLYDGD